MKTASPPISRIVSVAVVVLLIGWATSAAAAEPPLRVGAAVRIITPKPLLPLSGGFGPTAPAEQQRGELTARAVVFERGERKLAFVSLDLLGFPSVLCDRVRARVPAVPGENILIASTHNHSGPDCYAFPDGQGGHTGDLQYLESVCVKTAEAIRAALENLQPAHLRIATGEARGQIAYNYVCPICMIAA